MDAGIVSVQVVEAALLGVAQRFVRSANINEFLRRYILVVRVVVRVPLYSELAVGVPARRKGKPAPPVLLVRYGSSTWHPLYLLLACAAIEPEDAVWVPFSVRKAMLVREHWQNALHVVTGTRMTIDTVSGGSRRIASTNHHYRTATISYEAKVNEIDNRVVTGCSKRTRDLP